MERDLITELSDLTRQMADTDPASDSFGAMLERRGELMEQLCGRLRDAGDPRLESLERDGAALHSRLQSRCIVLREEMISLERSSTVVDGVKSTLAAPQSGVNLIA